jgi:hypothetical protein
VRLLSVVVMIRVVGFGVLARASHIDNRSTRLGLITIFPARSACEW